MPELKVRVPLRLTSRGSGVLAFSIVIEGNAYREWQRSCRIEGVSADGGCKTSGRFSSNGALQLTIPGDVGGRLMPLIELVDPEHGTRLTGAFSVEIRSRDETPIPGLTFVQNGEAGVQYSPVHIEGFAPREVEHVGDEAVVPVPLEAERTSEGVPLNDLLEREAFVALPERPGAPVRVLQVWAGPELVLGRCYGHQLEGKARQSLEALGHGRVHWVTNWDDDALNRVSVLFRDGGGGDERRLEIRNLTGYSRRGMPMTVRMTDGAAQSVAPGASAHLGLTGNPDLRLETGEGTNRRVLVRLDFEFVPAGEVQVPVYKTPGTTFCFPPDGGLAARPIHFLGVWIPWTPEDLKKRLARARCDVAIPFVDDGVFLHLHADRHGRAILTCNYNLRECLEEG